VPVPIPDDPANLDPVAVPVTGDLTLLGSPPPFARTLSPAE
jgi:hypothetical protein